MLNFYTCPQKGLYVTYVQLWTIEILIDNSTQNGLMMLSLFDG